MITKSAIPINDKEIIKYLKSINIDKLFSHPSPSPVGEYREEFIDTFKKWAKFEGRELGFSNWDCLITSGTTEAFIDFNLSYKEMNTYVMNGEYPYHASIGAKSVESYNMILENSKLIISYPFSASGNKHESFEDIMKYCCRNNIKVLVDCALIFISELEVCNFAKYDCVERVSFSLSKNFSSGRFRSGISFIRKLNQESHLALVNKWSYLNHLNLNIHIGLMSRFDRDYIYEKYNKLQSTICSNLSIERSSTVIFGLSHKEEFKTYSRSGYINRLCITKLLEESL